MSEAAAERLDASRFAEFYQFVCTTRVIAGRRLVDQAGFPAVVEGAIGDGCTLVNPREPTEEDFAELYAKAL